MNALTSCLLGVARMVDLVCSSNFRCFNYTELGSQSIQASYQEIGLSSAFPASSFIKSSSYDLQFHIKSKLKLKDIIFTVVNESESLK